MDSKSMQPGATPGLPATEFKGRQLMTRLTSGDIESLSDRLHDFDERLLRQTGRDMLGIACHCAGISKKNMAGKIKNLTAAAVTMTQGLGQITKFSRTIGDTLDHIGFHAFVPVQTDVAGIANAIEHKADIIFMADDHRYIALNPKENCLIDNSLATGRVFAAALDLMAKGIRDQNALVIGCGPVGKSAAKALVNFGAHVGIHDMDMAKCEKFCISIKKSSLENIELIHDLKSAGKSYCFFLEATNGKDIINRSMINPKTRIAAPGVPLGVSAGGQKKAGSQILYDPLQLGTAAMAVLAVLSEKRVKT